MRPATANASATAVSSVYATPLVTPTAAPPLLPTSRGAIPHGTSITELPLPGPYVAWTIDDGTDADVVAGYAEMAELTGNRLTFFLNGNQKAWTTRADMLRPLVESGQVQLANHTWSHPDLRGLSTKGIQDQLQRNEEFIQATYGVSGKPFFRPPFGYVNAHVRDAAAAIGYTASTLWYGSLADSGVLTPEQIKGFGDDWFTAGRVVIAHANHPAVLSAMQHLIDLIATRGLRTVTLADVFHI
ncbi:MAG: polysaccharide deacetylase family protein [Propionibacteriaceae bacterium]